ncbi:MAG: glycosyltransferase family 2 protein, partial [Elusimicrobia bacterium]|nr:glycosyltransferase family 2 protein [Elusimicrobiota bacterium]
MATKLSAVIITRNEERDLPDCLESLRGLADEIIVVD